MASVTTSSASSAEAGLRLASTSAKYCFRSSAICCAVRQRGQGFRRRDADGLVFQHTPAEKVFDQQLLVGGEILGFLTR